MKMIEEKQIMLIDFERQKIAIEQEFERNLIQQQ